MINLTVFCDPTRPNLSEPWSDAEYTYACDGTVGVRIPRQPEITRTDGPDLAKIIASTAPSTDMRPMPPIDVAAWMPGFTSCKHCVGLGYVKKCSSCSGSGECTCNCCDNEHECGSCDGRGHTQVRTWSGGPEIGRDHSNATQCNVCNGSGRARKQVELKRVELWPRMYLSARNVACMQTLPNVMLDCAVTDLSLPIRFTFDGGDGVVMTMSAPSYPFETEQMLRAGNN